MTDKLLNTNLRIKSFRFLRRWGEAYLYIRTGRQTEFQKSCTYSRGPKLVNASTSRDLYFFLITVLSCMLRIGYGTIVRESSDITQFRTTIATNCRVLTRCMEVSYLVGHERRSSLLFQRVLSVLWLLTINWGQNVKCNYYLSRNSI
jgi:hypothetical protein